MGNWWLIAPGVIMAIAVIPQTRHVLWGMIRGFVKMGDVVPLLPELPNKYAQLEETVRTGHAEILRAMERNSVETRAARQELRDHMNAEDLLKLTSEKVMVNLIRRQDEVQLQMATVTIETRDLKQVVMNGLEAGSGDRWRIGVEATRPVVVAVAPPIVEATPPQ